MNRRQPNQAAGNGGAPLLDIRGLKVYFDSAHGPIKAVDGVNLSIPHGTTVGIVGESGCGKSVSALAAMGLVSRPGRVVEGEILFHNNNETVRLTDLDPKGRKMRSIRGNQIAMIFQEPMTSLNPVFTIGRQIMETIRLHQKVTRHEARKKAIAMLEKVGIPLPGQRVDEYPHQLSGGMRQRAMIAMALSCRPSLLIADEPTTALDVTIQAQVLDLMADLKAEFNTSIMMITHDLGVVAGMADEVVVMYLGHVVEQANVQAIFSDPQHPYTRGLMASMPSLTKGDEDLQPIEGVVPDPMSLPAGCPFEPRCPTAKPRCRLENPLLNRRAEGHLVACWD